MGKIVIVVDKGRFRSVQEAANAQRMIDWSDSESADGNVCTECFCALDLQHHLQQISPDTEFIIGTEVPEEGDVIAIGRLAEGVDFLKAARGENPGRERFWIHTVKEGRRTITYLLGQTRSAVLYAISGYLELLGVRWFSPSKYGCHIPVIEDFHLPVIELSQEPSFKTRACYSELLDDSDEAFLDWLMHNRVNFVYLEAYHHTKELKKRGIQVCRGGHTILHQYFSPNKPYPYNHPYRIDHHRPSDPYPLSTEAVPGWDGEEFTYFHAHPEWYGLVNGERSRKMGTGRTEGFGDNFCTSNKDAVRELCGNLVKSLISGELSDAEYLNFWMLDNGAWCQCPECIKSGNETARLCSVVYQLNKSIQEARKSGYLKRDVTILFPAYHETLPLPDLKLPDDFDYEHCVVTYFPIERCYVHHLNDKACTETNSRLWSRLSAWAPSSGGTYRGELFIGEYYNVSSFSSISTFFAEKISHDIPLYFSMGARHMYYMHMTAKDWGTLVPTNYLFYSMLWDVELDAGRLLQEFYSLYYQEVSSVMKEFYGSLELGSANMKYFKHYQYLYEGEEQKRLALFGKLNQMAEREDEIFPLKHMQYDHTEQDSNAGISAVETMEAYHRCRMLLEKARFYCRDEVTAERLTEDTMRFEYTYLSLNYLFHMARLAIFHGSKRFVLARCEYQTAAGYAGQLKQVTEPLKGLLHFEFYKDGLGSTWAEQAFLKYSEIYGGDEGWMQTE